MLARYHLSSQREQLLLKQRHNLRHRHRHRYSSEFLKLAQQEIVATRQVNTFRRIPSHSSCRVKLPTDPPAFQSTQARQATAVEQTRSTREYDTTSGRPPPAVHHIDNESNNDPFAPRAHCDTFHITSHNDTSMPKSYECVICRE